MFVKFEVACGPKRSRFFAYVRIPPTELERNRTKTINIYHSHVHMHVMSVPTYVRKQTIDLHPIIRTATLALQIRKFSLLTQKAPPPKNAKHGRQGGGGRPCEAHWGGLLRQQRKFSDLKGQSRRSDDGLQVYGLLSVVNRYWHHVHMYV